MSSCYRGGVSTYNDGSRRASLFLDLVGVLLSWVEFHHGHGSVAGDVEFGVPRQSTEFVGIREGVDHLHLLDGRAQVTRRGTARLLRARGVRGCGCGRI